MRLLLQIYPALASFGVDYIFWRVHCGVGLVVLVLLKVCRPLLVGWRHGGERWRRDGDGLGGRRAG